MRRLLIVVCKILLVLWLLGMLAGVFGLVVAWGAYVVLGQGWVGWLISAAGFAWLAGLSLFTVAGLPPLLCGWWLEDTR